MYLIPDLLCSNHVALLAEGVDRNHDYFTSALPSPQSPSSRRAWIEIKKRGRGSSHPCVALLAEGVDRNEGEKENIYDGISVALLAEGVDRNKTS